MMACVVSLALVLAGVDGSPWEADMMTASQPAVRTVHGACMSDEASCYSATTQEFVVPAWAQCPQWWGLALEVGWPAEQMATLDYIMHRESRCDPGAVGPYWRGKHALGLTQLLGWACPPDGCLDPRSNLTKALDLWRLSGWHPWCLAGDPVTGRC
jgi:hypothetical protein